MSTSLFASIKSPKRGVLALVLAGALLVALAGSPASVGAVGLLVDSTADAVDSSPGDGVCATATGSCTLRAAIMEANDLAGADTITLPIGTYTLTIAGIEDLGVAGDLDITGDLTINGAGQATTIIDGGALDRVFQVHGVTVEISDVTIRNGSAAGGGIHSTGTLTLNRSTVSGNTATGGAGGIVNIRGTLNIIDSTISGNIAGSGGGVANVAGTAVLTNVIVSGNTAGTGRGGGIANSRFGTFSSTMTLTNVTVSGNTAVLGDGGGISNRLTTGISSTVSNNSAGRRGGGLAIISGTVTLADSTVSDNTAVLGGGGIENGASLTLTVDRQR